MRGGERGGERLGQAAWFALPLHEALVHQVHGAQLGVVVALAVANVKQRRLGGEARLGVALL